MSQRVVVLGAGFGGLELSTTLSEALGEQVEVTLIDKSEGFVFGYSKLDLMFGAASADEVRLPYADFVKPGVRLLRETVTAIDPEAKRVTTDAGVHEADYLVIALGADYDLDATPGLAEAGNEFYSVAGAERLAAMIPTFSRGHARDRRLRRPLQVPAGAERVRADARRRAAPRGVRDACEITFVIPLGAPVPPSPETSVALRQEFAERGIELIAGRRIAALDPASRVAVLDDGSELPFDLFLGVPKHRAPDVVIERDRRGRLRAGRPGDARDRLPGVYAVGDVATAGVPKAGVFAEGAARIVAAAAARPDARRCRPGRHLGQGTCYIEFGEGRIGSVDIDFLSGPERTGPFNPPSAEQMAQKEKFGASRSARWFSR